MMRMNLKQVAFAVAFGTAIAAGAQNPGSTSGARPADPAATTTQTRPNDACANVAAADKQACMERERARASKEQTTMPRDKANAPTASPSNPSDTPSSSAKSDKATGGGTPGPTK